MHKIRLIPHTLPVAVRSTISADAPAPGSDHSSCEEWLQQFGSSYYNRSLFFKGPLLTCTPMVYNHPTPLYALFSNINPYKTHITKHLLDIQSNGDAHEWLPSNHLIHNIHGLRHSVRVPPPT